MTRLKDIPEPLTTTILTAMRKRRHAGEGLRDLAKELRVPWQRLEKALRLGLPKRQLRDARTIRARISRYWRLKSGVKATHKTIREIERQSGGLPGKAKHLIDLYLAPSRQASDLRKSNQPQKARRSK